MKLDLSSLALKPALVLATAVGAALPSLAAIPTIDATNVVQTTISATEGVRQTAKQVEQYAAQLKQYQTQLQQFENMVQNTAAPARQIWDKAQATMNSLRTTIDTLSYYKQQLGSIDRYLAKFRDVNYYKNSPCFNGGTCSPATRAALVANQQHYQSESQKKANDALFKGLAKQQDALESDASTLQRLQSGAQGATGQMQALGYANQLASSQAHQLLQMRGLLIAQQNAATTRAQAQVDDEAMRAAASARARHIDFVPSPLKSYAF